MLELSDFNAYQLFNEISKASQKPKPHYHNYSPGSDDENHNAALSNSIDERDLFCFFKRMVQPGTLDIEITDSECSFIVKLCDLSNVGVITYEE
jgi:hypothetical protein